MTKVLFQLRRILLTHLGDIEQIKSIASKAGIQLDESIWKNAAVQVWHDVIRSNKKEKDLKVLLENIKLYNPQASEMVRLAREIKYWEETNQVLQEIPLDPNKMGFLDTINCGRKAESEDFWKPSDFTLEEKPLLTCLISGKGSERPSSLAKRLAFEFFGRVPDDQTICYLREGDGTNVQPLKLNSNKEIPIQIAIHQYLESFEQGCGHCGYTWCAHLIEVDVEACGKMVYRVLDILKEKFRVFSEKKELRTLLFITYPYSDTFDSTHLHQHLHGKSKALVPAKYYRISGGVNQKEIENWFNTNSAKSVEDVEKYLEPFLAFLLNFDQKRAFRDGQILPMNIMETIQERIFQTAMNSSERNSI